jgi:hypothetical protein
MTPLNIKIAIYEINIFYWYITARGSKRLSREMGNSVARVIPASHTSDNDAAKIALGLYWTCRTVSASYSKFLI